MKLMSENKDKQPKNRGERRAQARKRKGGAPIKPRGVPLWKQLR